MGDPCWLLFLFVFHILWEERESLVCVHIRTCSKTRESQIHEHRKNACVLRQETHRSIWMADVGRRENRPSPALLVPDRWVAQGRGSPGTSRQCVAGCALPGSVWRLTMNLRSFHSSTALGTRETQYHFSKEAEGQGHTDAGVDRA